MDRPAERDGVSGGLHQPKPPDPSAEKRAPERARSRHPANRQPKKHGRKDQRRQRDLPPTQRGTETPRPPRHHRRPVERH